MHPDKLDVDDLQLVGRGHDLAVVIALDSEDDPAILQDAGLAVLRLDVRGAGPRGMAGFLVGGFRGLFGFAVRFPLLANVTRRSPRLS